MEGVMVLTTGGSVVVVFVGEVGADVDMIWFW